MKYFLLIPMVAMFGVVASAMPKVGDSLTRTIVYSENGTVTHHYDSLSLFNAYDPVGDLFTIQQTVTLDGTTTVAPYTMTGTELADAESTQNIKIQNCASFFGGQVENYTLQSGQVVATCKHTKVFPDGYTIISNEAAIPGTDLVRREAFETIDGILKRSIEEVTAFTSL